MKAKPIPAILIGEGITALGTMRSLGEAGIPSYLINSHPEFVAFSHWYHKLEGAAGTVPLPERLGTFLESLDIPKGVLIPCADHWAMAVAALGNEYSDRFFHSLPKPEALNLMIDKWLFAEMLDREAIPHPFTCLLSSPADLDHLPEERVESAFLKPRDSHAFFHAYKEKACRLRGRERGKQQIKRKLSDGFAMVLQEYIPGPETSHYFIDGCVRADGSTAGLFARRRLRMYPPDFGNSSFMASVPIEEVRDAADSLVRLWPRVGYRGIFSAEFKRDSRDGVLKIIEINPRPWWYIEFATNCGVNVAEMAYRDALGLPVNTVTDYKIGRHSVFLDEDRLAYRVLHRQGKLSLWAWLQSLLGSHEMTFSWRDPIPSFAYFGGLARDYFRNHGPR